MHVLHLRPHLPTRPQSNIFALKKNLCYASIRAVQIHKADHVANTIYRITLERKNMTSKEGKPIFYGWWVAIACSVIYGLSGVGNYASSIFFPFISAEMGWTQAELGRAFSIYLWVFVCGGFLAGFLVDHIGGRKTFIIGAIISGTGLVLLSTIKSFTEFIIYYSAIASIGIAMQLVIPTQAVARKWFVKRAGLIAGIIAAAFGIISALLFPLLTKLSDVYGWRSILRQYAILFEVVVILLAIFIVRDTPESLGLNPDGASDPNLVRAKGTEGSTEEPYFTLLQALKTPQLWLIAISFGFATMVIVTYIGHLQMWAVNVGATPAATGTYMTAWALPSIFARVVGGWLGDKLGKRPVLIGVFAILVGVMAYGWLGVHGPVSLYIFSIASGFTMIVPAVLAAPFLGDLFGRKYLGTMGGFLGIIGGALAGFGPWFWGWMATTTGSDNQALFYMAIGYAIGCVCIACIRPTHVEKRTLLKR
jgi:MFS family permease